MSKTNAVTTGKTNAVIGLLLLAFAYGPATIASTSSESSYTTARLTQELDSVLNQSPGPGDHYQIKGGAPVLLAGHLEQNGQPRISEFERAAHADVTLSRCVLYGLPRLIRVSESTEWRQRVWKRMLREEWLFADRKSLRKIELLAAQFDMPVR